MRSLLEGNNHFIKEVFPALAEHFSELSGGQTPHTLLIACSDSRVDPSLITQTLPGEIFVIRNAGNLVPSSGEDDGTAAAVEYAINALRVTRVVVVGHSGCGAMAGVLAPTLLAELPTVRGWLTHAQPTSTAIHEHKHLHSLEEAVEHNALQQLENLKTHTCVREAIAEWNLQLEAWNYDIKTGVCRVLTNDTGGQI